MKQALSGIYRITNLINNKVYIGQSKNIERRYKEHFLKKYRKSDKSYIHFAILHYGVENFKFEVIKETYDLNYWEMFLIQIHHSYEPEFGYNLTIGGNYGTRRLDDFVYTDEIKNKMSIKAKERWNKEREKIISCQNKGKYTKEWSDKRREIANRMWKNGNFKNQAKKLSEYWKGKPKSEETKRRMSEAQAKRSEKLNADYKKYCDMGGTVKFREFVKHYHKTPVNSLLKELEEKK